MSHVNGGWLHCRDQSQTDLTMSDSNQEGELSNTASTASSAFRHRISQQIGSVNAVKRAQHSSEESSSLDMYSRSDARVIQGWRQLKTTHQVHPGTVQPKLSIGSRALPKLGPVRQRKELERAEILAGDLMSQQPECPVCLEAYCESQRSKIPRSLHCGHSICTGEVHVGSYLSFIVPIIIHA